MYKRQEGYETNHATGIKDAGNLIEQYNFDLAIIDMQLPDGTGFDVSEIFKNNATSVIFLTVVAVSYTHLDVYKRQQVFTLEQIYSNQALDTEGMMSTEAE